LENNKKFNPALCKADDGRTKLVVVEVLEKLFGFKLITPLDEQPEAFKAWDFQIEDPTGKLLNIEVEFVNTWNDRGRVPRWPNLSIPYRKKDSKAHYVFRVNHYLDTLAYTTMKKVLAAPVGKKNTRNTRSGEATCEEPFFFVALDAWRYYTKFGNNDAWHRVTKDGDPV
jgi:hypothetical protein